MSIKPQDILFLLKLVVMRKKDWSFNGLALELGMSPSQVHAAAKRVINANLAVKADGNVVPNIRNLEEFLFHGLQYVFVPEHGGLTRGVPTAYASAPMKGQFVDNNEPPPVWPDPEGNVRGQAFSPIFRSAPMAAKKDQNLYDLLALVDSLRGGRARERDFAKKELKRRFEEYGHHSES